MGYSPVSEYKIGKFPYDVYVPEVNLLIEYQGTRWHYDPRIYEAEYFDSMKKQFAYEKWKRDKNKEEIAVKSGYNFVAIWQYDWERIENKRRYIQKILRRYETEEEQWILETCIENLRKSKMLSLSA